MAETLKEIDVPIYPYGSIPFPKGVMNVVVTSSEWIALFCEAKIHDTRIGMVYIDPSRRRKIANRELAFGLFGVLVKVIKIKPITPDIYEFTCEGVERIQLLNIEQTSASLWDGSVLVFPGDESRRISNDYVEMVGWLKDDLQRAGILPVISPKYFKQSGWVANRWCELISLPIAEKEHLLMEMDPLLRLSEVYSLVRQAH